MIERGVVGGVSSVFIGCLGESWVFRRVGVVGNIKDLYFFSL